MLLYRLLFALLNIDTITADQLLLGLRSGVSAIIIIIAIAIGVTIPSIFIERYLTKKRQGEVNHLLALRREKAAAE